MLELRPYQADTLARSVAAEGRGVRRQLWVLATGLGKTVVFAELIARRGPRALVLVHRDELAQQAVVKLLESRDSYRVTRAARALLVAAERPDLIDKADSATGPTVGVVKATADDTSADVIVASVQTLANPTRLAALTEPPESLLVLPPIVTVVVDEAHHTPSPSYRAVIAALRAGEPDGPLLVGVTATPKRGDGAGLDDDYDEVVAFYDALWGITHGYLCDVRAIEVKMAGFNESDLKKSAGDYTAGSAGAALTAAHAPELIAQAWEQFAEDRTTVVFTPTVAVAGAVADAFAAIGVAAAAISGETPADERRHVLGQLRRGELLVVANCAVLTEGWDEPRVACVGMARPTTSEGLYLQMAGRGLRPHPAKSDCLVLDFVGNTEKHNLVTLPSLFGVAHDHRARDGSARLLSIVHDQAEALVATGHLSAAEVALFKKMPQSNIVWLPGTNPKTNLDQWLRPLGRTKVAGGAYRELPTVVLIRRAADADEWVTGLVFADGTKRVLIDRVSLATAQGVGEDYVRKNAASTAFVLADAEWRAGPPTLKQLAAARLFHVEPQPGWSAGHLADAIDNAKAIRRGLITQRSTQPCRMTRSCRRPSRRSASASTAKPGSVASGRSNRW